MPLGDGARPLGSQAAAPRANVGVAGLVGVVDIGHFAEPVDVQGLQVQCGARVELGAAAQVDPLNPGTIVRAAFHVGFV
ncbi:MAG: hypothetical protein RLZZ260_340, partial [Actinomycetota bacterium]